MLPEVPETVTVKVCGAGAGVLLEPGVELEGVAVDPVLELAWVDAGEL